jgi:Core-2/I-Branching enzyme
MKFAYLIFVHKNPNQFLKLAQRLDTADTLYFIHVDKKANLQSFKEVEKYIDPSKITWLPRQSIVWAGFNSIKATLQGLKVITQSNQNIGYVSFISGQDYPIKPITAYHHFLQNSNGNSFIEHSTLPRPNWANGGLDRIHYYHIMFNSFRLAFPPLSYLKAKLPFTKTKHLGALKIIAKFLPSAKKFPRKFLKDYVPYEGSNWFTFSAAMVKSIFDALDKDKDFYTFFKYTHHADEIFFQTLIVNKCLSNTNKVIGNNLRYVDWSENTGRPLIFKTSHFEALKNTDNFFARKFDEDVDKEIFDKIDKELLD